MSYATAIEMEDAFGAVELSQLAPNGSGGIDTAKVLNACERASRLADSYVSSAGRYVVPIVSPGADLVGAVLDIARADLYDQVEPEAIAKRRDRAISWLRDVASGRATLFDAATQTTAESVSRIKVVSSETIFDDATIAKMV